MNISVSGIKTVVLNPSLISTTGMTNIMIGVVPPLNSVDSTVAWGDTVSYYPHYIEIYYTGIQNVPTAFSPFSREISAASVINGNIAP
jgi:hypothetical protein